MLSQAQGPPAGAPRRARYVLLLTVTTQLPNFCHLSRRATARTTAVSVLSRYATRRRFLTRLRLDARKPDGGSPWGVSLLELKHGRMKLVREFEYSNFSCFFFHSAFHLVPCPRAAGGLLGLARSQAQCGLPLARRALLSSLGGNSPLPSPGLRDSLP